MISPMVVASSWSIFGISRSGSTKPYHAAARTETTAKEPPTMIDQTLNCLTEETTGALPLHTVRPGALETFLAGLPDTQRSYLSATGFAAKAGELRLLPGPEGLGGAVLGLGEDRSPYVFGALPDQLPE